uniref:Uncharacterized protein n=1 Tax=Fagus sylvatica TaxID=28930 RepID=A0A2N9IB53_FAGSY
MPQMTKQIHRVDLEIWSKLTEEGHGEEAVRELTRLEQISRSPIWLWVSGFCDFVCGGGLQGCGCSEF